ncbi:MAG: glycosyltransferase family 39 protein [Rubrivivax sp.]|nr:glycosyltransferase family 39 protein [Rubrivivax sp.]
MTAWPGGATRRCGGLLAWAVVALLLVRLASLAMVPLMDTTEARYADIARRMVQGGDWITPWFTETVPFWGKPPLSFWATALSFKLLGVNEFAARLPHLLLGVAVAALVWRHARRHSRRAAWHAMAWLGASSLFLVASGAVMTDMALALGTTLVMVGFWKAFHGGDGRARMPWAMVLGAAIGLLAKGPVSVILWGVPVVGWVLFGGHLVQAWRRIAWLRGAALVLVVSLPWYAWAESRTPGFLEYFIVGEHWMRFVTPGWKGDLYGSAHIFPRGAIWLFALGAVAPWPFLLPALFPARRPAASAPAAFDPGERRYLLLWALTPCLFFTPARNILWTYVLPGLPALALLAGRWSATRERQRWAEGVLTSGVVLSIVATLGLIFVAQTNGRFDRKSAKAIVAEYRERRQGGEPLYFLDRVPFSGSFYSDGQARVLERLEALPGGGSALVVLAEKRLAGLPADERRRLEPLARRGDQVLARWR